MLKTHDVIDRSTKTIIDNTNVAVALGYDESFIEEITTDQVILQEQAPPRKRTNDFIVYDAQRQHSEPLVRVDGQDPKEEIEIFKTPQFALGIRSTLLLPDTLQKAVKIIGKKLKIQDEKIITA